jgi:hypothetical protein
MAEETGATGKPLDAKISVVDSVVRDAYRRNVLLIHKRTLTFKDGVLTNVSPLVGFGGNRDRSNAVVVGA